MTQFDAFQVTKDNEGNFHRTIVQLDTETLPDHPVLIDVQCSSLNFKDAMSATGNPGVTRVFPHVPGVDAAGTVLTWKHNCESYVHKFACNPHGANTTWKQEYTLNRPRRGEIRRKFNEL